MESLLLDPASAIPDKELEALLKSDFDTAERKLSQKAGETSTSLAPPEEKEFDSTMTELVSSAIAEASGAEIVFYSTAERTFSIAPVRSPSRTYAASNHMKTRSGLSS
jgi:2',3'-cyclic-nucleotide 2'-phosphodiesterase (5'-nucleotidase family)